MSLRRECRQQRDTGEEGKIWHDDLKRRKRVTRKGERGEGRGGEGRGEEEMKMKRKEASSQGNPMQFTRGQGAKGLSRLWGRTRLRITVGTLCTRTCTVQYVCTQAF